MKKIYVFLLSLCCLSAFSQNVTITKIIETGCSNPFVKSVELYVDGTVDFSSEVTLNYMQNGAPWADNQIDISALGVQTDSFVYIIRDIALMQAEFPSTTFDASNTVVVSTSTNGDDGYQVVLNGEVVSQFGKTETDADDDTDSDWRHQDAVATRLSGIADLGTWDPSHWDITAENDLDDHTNCQNGPDNNLETYFATLGGSFPLGSYTPPATGPDVAPDAPTQDQADVVSVFSEAYTGNTGFTTTTFGTPGNNSTGEFLSFASNEVLKVTYDGGDFIGLEFDSAIDASAMEFFHVDVWIDNPIPVGAVSTFKWSNHGGGHLTGETDSFTSTQILSEGQNGQWLSFNIPLNSEGFPGQTGAGTDARSILSQLVLNAASADGTYGPFYFDNIYFWKEPSATGPAVSAPDPTEDSDDVISMFSNVYTNVPVDTWLTPWSSAQLEDIQIDGNDTKLYTNLDFAGIETVSNPIDASDMDFIHLDVWSPNATTFRVKLVDLGDGAVEGEIPFNIAQGEWVNLKIPLEDFANPDLVTNPGNLLTVRNSIQQLIISGLPVGEVTAYIDNVYFSQEPSASGDCAATGTFDYEDNSDITNSLNGFVADNPDDYITLTFTEGSTESCCDTWFINDAADGSGNTIASGNGSIVGSYESITGEISFYVESDTSIQGTTFVYELSCAPPPSCPAPTALATDNLMATSVDLTWTPGGSETEWEVLFGEEGFDPETDGTLINDDDGVLGVTLSDLAPETPYDAYVRAVCGADDVSEWVLITFTTPIAPVVVSPDSPESDAYCYDNNVFEEWLFESSNGAPLVIEFLQGSVEINTFAGNTYDDLVVYDGSDSTGEVLYNSDEDIDAAADLTGLTLTAESGFMYITLDSDGSVSCVDPGFGDPQTEIQFEVSVFEPQFANVQIIHNSADPAAEFVDVYINDVLVLDDVEFRTATSFLELPAGTPVSIDIAGAGSGVSGDPLNPDDSLYNLTTTLAVDESYVVVANGVLNPADFNASVNSIDFELNVFAGAQQASTNPGETSLLVNHGSPDAPTVDVVETSVPAGILVDDISYPEFQGYVDVGTADYILNVETADNSAVVATYEANLATLGLSDVAITVLASGFLDPSVNQNGAAFGLWVALPSGGPLVELPVVDDSGYCVPVPFPNGCSFGDFIDSFEVPAATFSHLDTGCIGESTYGDYSADANLELNLVQTVPYDFSITHGWNQQIVKMWVDYNLDSVFDESEILFVSDSPSGGTSGNPDPTVGVITIPSTVAIGSTRMRVVTRFSSEPLDPCDPSDGAASAWGEVHDYTVNILPPPSCVQPTDIVTENLTAISTDLSWAPGGTETEWEVLWGEAGFDPLTEGTLINDDDGVLGVTLLDLSPVTSYDVYVRAICSDTDISEWTFFTFTTPIAPVIVSPGPPEFTSVCYDNDEFFEYLFQSFDGSPLVIEFLQGSVETFFDDSGTFDDLIIYDGQDDTGVVLFDSDEEAVTANDLTGLTLIAESGFMYITLDSDGSISCADGDQIEIQFEVSLQTIGTTQFDAGNFGFYPNPVDNQLNFETTNQIEEVRVYNIQGRQVIFETLNAVSPKLNVGSLQSGTYIMSVTIDGVSKNFKLIKR